MDIDDASTHRAYEAAAVQPEVNDLTRITFRLPMKMPSMNKLRGRWAENNWRRKFERALGPALPPRLACKGPARLTVIRVLGPREKVFDQVNLEGGIKPLQDALVRLGYLAGDTPELCRHAVAQSEQDGRKNGPMVVVTVERIAELKEAAAT